MEESEEKLKILMSRFTKNNSNLAISYDINHTYEPLIIHFFINYFDGYELRITL